MLVVAAEKLRDPDYFGLHLEAAAAIREVGALGWYDAHFLRRYEVAKHYLARVQPDALAAFTASFAPLIPAEDFREIALDDVFDAATHAAIREASLTAEVRMTRQLEDENATFGRNVVWDEPFYLELQEQMRPRLEGVLGRPLVSSYNFLSLYGAQGKCEPHLDHPNAMFTFDYCIDQDEVWPIYIGRPAPWPDAGFAKDFDPAALKADPAMDFRAHELRPNRALIFNGSSQWHFREPKSSGAFCNLLFFHYYPAGCEDLVQPARWAECTGIAALGPLCDLFATL
mgnify:CR=1 FL=1